MPNEPVEPANSISDIEDDIEQTREELGHTVDALKGKFDVKAQARHKVDDVKASASRIAADVKDAATAEDGKPKPAVPIGGIAIVAAVALIVVLLRRRR